MIFSWLVNTGESVKTRSPPRGLVVRGWYELDRTRLFRALPLRDSVGISPNFGTHQGPSV